MAPVYTTLCVWRSSCIVVALAYVTFIQPVVAKPPVYSITEPEGKVSNPYFVSSPSFALGGLLHRMGLGQSGTLATNAEHADTGEGTLSHPYVYLVLVPDCSTLVP